MKTKVLLYCTKAKPYLMQGIAKPMHSNDLTNPFNFYWRLSTRKMTSAFTYDYSGKIVASCDLECDEIGFFLNRDNLRFEYQTQDLTEQELLKKSCLTENELYGNLTENGYAYFITNLKTFDKPISIFHLMKYHTMADIDKVICHKKTIGICNKGLSTSGKWVGCIQFGLTKAPQNMCWVLYEGEKYLWLPCKPKELCYLFNGDATALVRKKILKGMQI